MAAFYYSPSQISTYRDCPRKWFYSRTLDRPRRDTAATLKGKKIHKQLEDWLKSKVPPENDRARALLPLLPLPHESLLIEHEIRLLTPAGLLRGYIDLLVPDPTEDWPAELPKLPTVFDHKTTIDLWNAKTEAALTNDPQALLYGLALRVLLKERGQDPEQDIQCVWNYTCTGAKVATQRVRVQQSFADAEKPLATIFAEAQQMRAYLQPQPVSADTVPVCLSSCSKYGGCEFADVCPDGKKPRSVWDEETPAPEPHLVTIGSDKGTKKMATPTSELLARLKKLQSANLKTPAAPAPEPEPAPPAPEPTSNTTPEPKLETPDLSGVPEAPAGEAAIVPPDAPAPKKRAKKSLPEEPPARSSKADRLLDLLERLVEALEK